MGRIQLSRTLNFRGMISYLQIVFAIVFCMLLVIYGWLVVLGTSEPRELNPECDPFSLNESLICTSQKDELLVECLTECNSETSCARECYIEYDKQVGS